MNEIKDGFVKTRWVSLDSDIDDPLPLPGWIIHAAILLVFEIAAIFIYLKVSSGKKIESCLIPFESSVILQEQMQPSVQEEVKMDTSASADMKQTINSDFVPPLKDKSKIKKINLNADKKKPDLRKVPIPKPDVQPEVPAIVVTPPTKLAETPKPIRPSVPVLDLIRQDPGRIYVDAKYVEGDLTFSFRNASDHGIEIYVENNPNSGRTYYFPKVIIEGNVSQFEDRVLSPGKGTFGWISIPQIRERKKLKCDLSAVGCDTRRETLKLDW